MTATWLGRATAGLGLAVVVLMLSAAAPPGHDTGPVATEPYRHLPPLAEATAPAATARVSLQLTAGRTTQGLIVRSAERVPQVSLFVPPAAFAAGAGSGTVVVEAAPVAPSGSEIPGDSVSNVYEVRFTSPAGPVTVQASAQPLGITLRSVDAERPTPIMRYRPDASSPWTSLETKRLGFDIYHSDLPGAGHYVLSREDPAAAPKPARSGSKTWLIVVGLVLVAPLLGLVRLLSRRPS